TVLNRILKDPSGDDYVAALDNAYDQAQARIIDRYKYVNNTEANASSNNPWTTFPDGNDLNGDYNTNLNERFMELSFDIDPAAFKMGVHPFIVSETDVDSSGKKATAPSVKWYMLRLPISEFRQAFGAIELQNIRFMRIILDNFNAPIILRCAQFSLITAQ